MLPLLPRLPPGGIAPDNAKYRKFFADHAAARLLLYFGNPVLTSRNALLQATHLDKVPAFGGGHAVCAGAFTEAQHLCDPALRQELVSALARRVPDTTIPQAGDCLTTLKAARLSVSDRGYAEYPLFQDIRDAGSQFVGRRRVNAVWEVVEERSVSAGAGAAGVRRDRVVWRGGEQSTKALRQPLRGLEVATGKTDSPSRAAVRLLATRCLALAAELVTLADKFRWEAELYCRRFKCGRGRRHGVSESLEGQTVQAYEVLMAQLLLPAGTGKQPTQGTFEMFC